jgi:predicted anti-sigma-YlaC factor YlaD
MNCTEARGLLLEAELAELRGEGESEVARHVRECTRCRAMAQEIVEQEGALAQALAGVRPQVSADTAAAETAAAKVLSLRPRWKRRWAAIIPAALAATVAGILLTSNGTPPAVVPSTTEDAAVAAVPVVDATSSDTYVVFNTDNPDIVVVWLY